MTVKRAKWTSFCLASVLCLSASGCIGVAGPSLGLFGIPIPVSPYTQHQQEEKYWEHERYERVPVLGPLTAGGPAVALDPPSDDEVMRALEKARPVQGGIPFLSEKQRNNVRIVKRENRGLCGPATVRSDDRTSSVTSRSLQVHHLL